MFCIHARFLYKKKKSIKEMKKVLKNFVFQGKLYLHNLTVDENTYAMMDMLPDGEFIYNTLVYSKINDTDHLLLETKTHCEIKAKGLFRFK